jgi:hypothetical protein
LQFRTEPTAIYRFRRTLLAGSATIFRDQKRNGICNPEDLNFRTPLILIHQPIDLGFKVKWLFGFSFARVRYIFGGGADAAHGGPFADEGAVTPGNLRHVDMPSNPLLYPSVETVVLLNGVPCLPRSLKRVFRGSPPDLN